MEIDSYAVITHMPSAKHSILARIANFGKTKVQAVVERLSPKKKRRKISHDSDNKENVRRFAG